MAPFQGWGPLSIKEYFTYGEILLPRAFDTNRFVPFGGGACAGCKLVLGPEVEIEAMAATSALLGRMPADDKEAFRQGFQQQANKLPEAVPLLPGFQARLAAEQPLTVLDLQVSFCWFQAFIESRTSKWNFAREAWSGSII
uniref:Uncharacterized protein n=1 Tax=Alexandrium andersonii TaxID=327968 RepID=A0A7S2DHN2_9DINO